MTRTPSPKQLEARFRARQEEYERIKANIRDVGFICEGSLLERWMTCRKPNCRCAADPAQRHGPYYQLTRKERGRTVCRNLSPEHALLYRQWIANRRELDALVKRMREVSEKAGSYLLDAASQPSETSPDQPRKPRSGRSSRT